MIISNTLLIFAIVNSVRSSDLKKDLEGQVDLLEKYNYNHPPLFEASQAPADRDELESRKAREVFQNKSVPVTVVYDLEDDVSNIHKIKKKQSRRPNPIHARKDINAKIGDSEYISNKKKPPTEIYSSTSPSPKTVVPKMFTKRPPQDNPTIKKVRQHEPEVKIVQASNYVFAHNGNFRYSFEDTDGTKVSSEGELKSFSDDITGEAVVGRVSYKDNEGNYFSLSYTADEKGYRPSGAHLPTPPPTPEAIARALKYLATKTTPQSVTEATKHENFE